MTRAFGPMSRSFFWPSFPDDIVLLDTLGSHRSKAVRQLIRLVGDKLFFLPNTRPI